MKRRVELTLHERQMRFFTILFLVLGVAVFLAVFWLINRSLLVAP
jgi:hypothetical protein